MNIQQVLSLDGRVNLTVTALELKEFGLSLIKEARQIAREEYERQQSDKDEMMNTREVCRRLRVTQNTLGNWRKSKTLLPIKNTGGRYLYRKGDVEEFARLYAYDKPEAAN